MIDTHAHIFFDELLEQAGPYGPRIAPSPAGGYEVVTGNYRWPIGTSTALGITAQERVDRLDAEGITHQVLSLSPLWLFHNAPADVAVPFLTMANDLLDAWRGGAPDRLSAFAALPAQDIGAAIAELERCIGLGFVGGYIGTSARSGLDDADLDDLYAACEDLDVPLFIHSAVPGVDGPAGDPRLTRWLGNITLGYPIEETIAVASLVLGGVLDRHLGIDILISHGGGAFPMLMGRVLAALQLPKAPVSATDAAAAYQRLWFDTHVHSRESLDLLTSVAASERLVFGSNFGGWDTAHVADVLNMAPLLDANARHLLRMPADRSVVPPESVGARPDPAAPQGRSN